MALEKSAALVIGSFPLGESDRVVTFFTRRFGKVRGVARAARRMKSRFGGALQLFTQGELLFFDGGRSELVQVDHFDVTHPFASVRGDLESLGQAAWMAECVARLTPERDPSPAIYGLLARGLGTMEERGRPSRVAAVFGVRFIDALGHRLRTDACVECGRPRIATTGTVAVDVEGGGTVCPTCAQVIPGLIAVTVAAVTALTRLRTLAWDQALEVPLGRVEQEVRRLLEAQTTRLAGQPSPASRFLREVSQVLPLSRGPE
jgi:DNA repair protein RecO (recombination protein O)